MSLHVGVKHTARGRHATLRLEGVLRDVASSASADRVLAAGFWGPARGAEAANAAGRAPAPPIDLALARARR